MPKKNLAKISGDCVCVANPNIMGGGIDLDKNLKVRIKSACSFKRFGKCNYRGAELKYKTNISKEHYIAS